MEYAFSSKTFGLIAKNARIKEFPGWYEICVASDPLFLPPGYEAAGWQEQINIPAEKINKGKADSLPRSQARARRNIRDIALCSAFTHFVTLTLDKEQIERYDYAAIMKRVNRWLSNAVQRKNFAYLIIPEHHKDGAIHFHGLVKGELKYQDSGKRTKANQPIYNMVDWKFGFTACIELIGEYEKIVNYIRKYITKDSRKVGGRWYLSGGNIGKPEVRLTDLDYREVEGKEIFIRPARVSLKYFRVEKTEKDLLFPEC